jgi:hypothetical protein
MTASYITYGDLAEVLTGLGFVSMAVGERWRAYRHVDSDTLIVLAKHDWEVPARKLDLVSVRRQLLENALIDENELEARLMGGLSR